MKRKMKLKYKIRIASLILIVILILFGLFKLIFPSSNEVSMVSKIDGYNYKLESNNTSIYKKYFKELDKALSSDAIDEEKYVNLISKLFLIDFYNLSNKITNQDVGGLQYIYDSYQDNFRQKAIDGIYKYIKSNIYKNRKQELPTVKDVSIDNIEKSTFSYNDIVDNDCYKVHATINYKKDLGYANKVNLIIIHSDNKLSIVEVLEER